MNSTEYARLTAAQMGERRWRTTRALRNGLIIVPAGTAVRITGKRNGVTVETDPCSCCGVAVFVKRCSPGSVEEVTDASP